MDLPLANHLVSVIAFCDNVFVHMDEGRVLMEYTIPLLFNQYRLKILTEQHAFEKELEFIEGINPNMSQQCVLIMYMADWDASVTSRCIEDYLPFLGTAMVTWATLFPALGPHSLVRILRTGEGAGKRLQVSAWEVHIGHCTLPGRQCNTGTEQWWNVRPLTSRLSNKTTDLV